MKAKRVYLINGLTYLIVYRSSNKERPRKCIAVRETMDPKQLELARTLAVTLLPLTKRAINGTYFTWN